MKRLLAVFAVCAASAMAADVTGFVMDQKCSGIKGMQGNEACAKKCFGDGYPAVLVTEEGKVYKVANQDKVIPSAGKKVTVTGKLDGETITVDTIAPAKS
jgi:hypothetical protein